MPPKSHVLLGMQQASSSIFSAVWSLDISLDSICLPLWLTKGQTVSWCLLYAFSGFLWFFFFAFVPQEEAPVGEILSCMSLMEKVY